MSAPEIKIIGTGFVAPEGLDPARETACDVAPLLKDRKSIKFMSKQDKLALAAACAAVNHAKLGEAELSQDTGIYLAMGVLPFEEDQINQLADHSATNGVLDPQRYSTEAFQLMNPLLTFKCLPNMPVFHISYNLGIHGAYFVTYPGTGQFFRALEQALSDLRSGIVKHALVGAAADQRNMLVRHHIERSAPEELPTLIDAACVLVLSSEPREKALAKIGGLEVSYEPVDPFAPPPQLVRADGGIPKLPVSAGAATAALEIAHALGSGRRGLIESRFEAPDGVSALLKLEAL